MISLNNIISELDHDPSHCIHLTDKEQQLSPRRGTTCLRTHEAGHGAASLTTRGSTALSLGPGDGPSSTETTNGSF